MGSSIRVGCVIKHYRILNCLGEGSSGQVFIASDPRRQIVVLKCIPLKTAWFQKEFEREVNSLSKCKDCPLIVKMIQSFKYKSYGVIVLERLRGDLLDHLQQNQPLSVDYVKNIFFQICVAVLYLHKRCIAHLDIKPENIFMASFCSVKLGDFGSSYHWQTDFESKLGAVGTSYYCAPEVGPSHPYNPQKADTWSLGILLHVLLTGFWPYKGKTEAMLHENVKNGRRTLFTESLPQDPVLLELLDGLLHHDPDMRYSVNDALKSDWLSSVGAMQRNRPSLRGGSTPNLHTSLDSDEEEEEEECESSRELKKEERERESEDSAPDVFNFSDEEIVDPDFENTWDMTPPSTSNNICPLTGMDLQPNSLPKLLNPEPMKKPRQLISIPTSQDTASAAPIKKSQTKRRRRSSLLNFFSSKKTRRASAADSERRSGLSLNL